MNFQDNARLILFQNNMAEDSLLLGHITVALREAFEAGAKEMREKAAKLVSDRCMWLCQSPENDAVEHRADEAAGLAQSIRTLPLSLK